MRYVNAFIFAASLIVSSAYAQDVKENSTPLHVGIPIARPVNDAPKENTRLKEELVAGQNKKISADEVLAAELKTKASAIERISLINTKLNMGFIAKNPTENLTMEETHAIFDLRDKECKEAPQVCGQVLELTPALCHDFDQKKSIESYWERIIDRLPNEVSAKSVLVALKGCPKSTYGKFYGLRSLAGQAISQKWPSVMREAVTLMSSGGKTLPQPSLQYWRDAMKLWDELNALRPIYVDSLYSLYQLMSGWVISPAFSEIRVDERNAWAGRAAILLGGLGRVSEFANLMSAHSDWLATMKPNEQIDVVSAMCHYWAHAGQLDKCGKSLSELKKLTPGVKIGLSIQEIWFEYHRGQRASAIKKLEMLRAQSDSHYGPWIEFSLSMMLYGDGKTKEARGYFESHRKRVRGMEDQPWFTLYTNIGATSLLIEEKSYAAAQEEVNKFTSDINKLFASPVSFSAWRSYQQVFLSLQKKDSVEAQKAYDQLTTELKWSTDNKFLGLLAEAMIKSSKGQPVDLGPAKKMLGNDHLEIKRVQEFIALMAPSKGK